MSTSSVSVIIPVYNGGAFLAAAIQSVLDQQVAPREIVVIDDGSTDRSASVARGFAPWVMVLQQENQGPAVARNLGIDWATGDYLCFLDADDLMPPSRLAIQRQLLDERPEVDLVFGQQLRFQQGEVLDLGHPPPDRGEAAIIPGTMCCRRLVFEKYGRFDTKHALSEFIPWFARVKELGAQALTSDKVVLLRRMHERNLSKVGSKREWANSVHAILQARRARRRGAA